MLFIHKFYKHLPSILRGLMEITNFFFHLSRIMQRWVFQITNNFYKKSQITKGSQNVSWKIILPNHEERNDPSAPSILDTNESPDF